MNKLKILIVPFLLCGAMALSQSTAPTDKVANDDQALHRQVHEQLATNPDLQNVQITVSNGEVQLSGSVPNKADKKEAGRLAKAVQGVKKVREDLNVSAIAASSASDSKAPENTAGSIAGNAASTTSVGSATSKTPESDSAASAREQSTSGSPSDSSIEKPSTGENQPASQNPEQPGIPK